MSWKKILLFIALLPLLGLVIILTWPGILLNQKNLSWLLSRDEVTQQVSWDSLEVDVKKPNFLENDIQIKSENLCAQLNKTLLDLDFCLKKADINLTIHPHRWPFISTSKASYLEFSRLQLNKWPQSENKSTASQNEKIEISKIWKSLWKLPLPILTLKIPSIGLPEEKNIKNLDLILAMTPKGVQLNALGVQFDATKKRIQLSVQNWSAGDFFDQQELANLTIENFILEARITKQLIHIQSEIKAFSARANIQSQIPSSFQTNFYEDARLVQNILKETVLKLELESIRKVLKSLPNKSFTTENIKVLNRLKGGVKALLKFKINDDAIKPQLTTSSDLNLDNKELNFKLESSPLLRWKWPLDKQEFLRRTLLATNAKLNLKSIKTHLPDGIQEQWGQLPSPLNNFNGPAEINLTITPGTSGQNIDVHLKTDINLSHGDQRLHLTTTPILTIGLSEYRLVKTNLALVFNEVKLRLPNIYLTQAIPQFGPDARIQSSSSQTKSPPINKTQKRKEENDEDLPLNLNLTTPKSSPIKLTTNLIEDPLFIDLDMDIVKGTPDGDVNVRPFKTTIFKRNVEHKKTVINFNKSFSTTLSSEVHFPVPNYQIILKIEGPLDDPRPLLSSIPPLPEDDIISVLLFGQPLNGLSENEQASAANRTSQILSEGLLSLSVLYFLSDTPIQSIGVDPETQKVSAQIGLDQKSSLNLSGQEDGTKKVGVRRSIGKGWFIDTSMQKSSLDDQSDQKDYGVLVERIISY